MRTPKLTAKRALGLTAAVAIAFTGTIGVAQSSQAAVSALKLSTATFGEGGGQVVTVTGKDFQTAAGADKVTNVWFAAGSANTACDYADRAGAGAATFNVVSGTKLVTTAPDVNTGATVTVHQLCIAQGGAVSGAAKITAYPAPSISAASSTTGPSFGGTSITITGDDFTTKTTASIGGKPLTGIKVVLDKTGSDDTVTGVLPAGTGTGKSISVTNEGGTVNFTGTTFSYLEAIKVAPSVGDGVANRVITVTGTGFKDKTFAATATANSSVVALTIPGSAIVAASALPTAGTGTAAPKYCTSIKVVSDTELNCKLPALLTTAAGSYSIQVADFTGSATTPVSTTAVSRTAAYTAAAF